jgi:hypothetical protein
MSKATENASMIPLELPPDEAAAFSQFTKRIDYDTVGHFTAPTVTYDGRTERMVRGEHAAAPAGGSRL